MKKYLITLLIITLLFGVNYIEVNAAHQHSAACYTIQGSHTHSGDSVNGGGCYTVEAVGEKECIDTVQSSTAYHSGNLRSCGHTAYISTAYNLVCPISGIVSNVGCVDYCYDCGALISSYGTTSGDRTHV